MSIPLPCRTKKYVLLSHLQQLCLWSCLTRKKRTISSPPRIVSIATGFGSVLWTFIMPMVMIFILRQDRNYAGHFNTWKSFKLPQAIDAFFFFWTTLPLSFSCSTEGLNHQADPKKLNWPFTSILLGLLNLATCSLLLVSGSVFFKDLYPMIHWRKVTTCLFWKGSFKANVPNLITWTNLYIYI